MTAGRAMSAGERDLWISVYAASWHATGARVDPGPVRDEERARWCALQAARAVAALRAIGGSEVLR